MSPKPLQWFRLYAEAIDDEKLRLLAFEDRWHYVALLCCKASGLLDAGDPLPMLQRKLAVKLGLQLREIDAMALRLAEVGLIDAETFQPLAWDERQFKSDTSTERVKAYRERMKQRCNVSETTQETETETETHKSKSRARPAPLDLPAWLPADAWRDWHDYRNTRKGWTAKARKLSLAKLEALHAEGQDPRAVIEQSIERGWTGLFPVHGRSARGSPPAAPSKTMQGLMALEDMKRGLVRNRNPDGAAEAALPLAGPDPGA